MIDFRRMRIMINSLQETIWNLERMEANATRITSNITGMPRGGSGNRQEDAMIALADAREAYREAFGALQAMRDELEPLIDTLLEDPDERAVMRLRYIKGYRPSSISTMLFKSERSVYYYLNRAEHKIARKQHWITAQNS